METKNLCYFVEWWGETTRGGGCLLMKSGLSVRVMPCRSSQMIWQMTRLFVGRPLLHTKPSISREDANND